MRIALTTIGTTGDLQPFLALAVRLKSRGHAVRICSHAMFRQKVEALGVEFFASAPDFTVEYINRQVDVALNTLRPVKVAKHLTENILMADCEQRFKDCVEGLRGFDLVVCHHGDFAGQEAAISLGLPWVSTALSSDPLPSDLVAPFPLKRISLGRTINRALWNFVRRVFHKYMAPGFKRMRAISGVVSNELPDFFVLSPHLALLALSRHVADVEADAPKELLVTGSWFLDESANYTPPAALEKFLAAGPPPLVVSFGSMGGSSGKELAEILMKAIKQSGQRAIVQRGWAGVEIEADDRLFSVDYVPHSYLFTVASCVIHHGGAGTTAAACRAGRPQIVVPHVFDQFNWARNMTSRGVAPGMLLRHRLSARRLLRRIEEVRGDAGYARRAEALGERVRAEDGLGVAVEAIERLARSLTKASAS